jgi:hypothetical protein
MKPIQHIACGLMIAGLTVFQARAAEEFTTPWEQRQNVDEVLHVSAARGDDGSPGTPDQPVRTLQRAVDLAKAHAHDGRGTRVVLAAGTYRETVDIADRAADAPLIIEAEEPGQAIISGSDVFSDWNAHAGRDGVLEAAWPHKMGWVPNPWPGLMELKGEGLRRELLFIDGHPMRQVADLSELSPGTYLVDEPASRLLLKPPDGVEIAKSQVEVSVRPQKRTGVHSKLLRAAGVKNLTLRGLVFEHAASNPFNDPAVVIRGCQNVLIEHCTMRYNNGVGLGFSAPDGQVTRNVRIVNVKANENGTLGMEGTFHNGVIEKCETSRNNWRGAQWGATGWAPCGFKFAFVDGLVMRDHQAISNHASGAWFDDSNANVLIERLWSINNFRSGISLEANVGRFVIRDSIFTGNSTGVNGFDSGNVTIENCLIAANMSRQIRIAGSSPISEAELKDITPGWRRHRLGGRRPPENWTLRGNVIGVTAEQSKARLIDFWMRGEWDDPSGKPYFDRTIRSLVDESNTFSHPDEQSGKLFPSADGTGSSRAQWQQMGRTQNAVWSAEAIRKALEDAERETGHKPTGFAGGHTEDTQLGQ